MNEYEIIRLLDYKKITQEECALHMGIARTTITKIFKDARFKLNNDIVNGKRLQIKNGKYVPCLLDKGHIIIRTLQ